MVDGGESRNVHVGLGVTPSLLSGAIQNDVFSALGGSRASFQMITAGAVLRSSDDEPYVSSTYTYSVGLIYIRGEWENVAVKDLNKTFPGLAKNFVNAVVDKAEENEVFIGETEIREKSNAAAATSIADGVQFEAVGAELGIGYSLTLATIELGKNFRLGLGEIGTGISFFLAGAQAGIAKDDATSEDLFLQYGVVARMEMVPLVFHVDGFQLSLGAAARLIGIFKEDQPLLLGADIGLPVMATLRL